MRTIGDIVRLGAKRRPTHEAVVMGERRLTYADLEESSGLIARALVAAGVASGERVAVMAENCVEFMEVAFGVLRTGAVLAPLNFRYGPNELDYVLRDVSPSVVFAGPGYVDAVTEAISRCSLPIDVVALEGTGPRSLAGLRSSATGEVALPAVDPSSVATILYTSGTTGHPKGVLATHDATMRLLPMYGVEGGLQRDDVMLVCMPLFHGGGLVIQALAALFFGATVVLDGRGFDPEKVLALVRAEKVSITLWAPTMLAILAASGQTPSEGIRTIWYGSSSITPAVLSESRRMFPAAGFFQWYGTTEATSIAVLRPEDHDAHPGATGREILTADVRIIDFDSNDVPVGGTGEVVLAATGTVMVGYFNNPAATEATIRDGWMHTGDIAEVHEDGYFTIIGRGSDMIVTGGENVYPAEIEGVLADHPLVRDAAVFGVPDEVYGQRVAAAVVVTEHIDAQELQKYIRARIARYKVPRELHVLDALPRNASGKVLRRRQVERFTEAPTEGRP